MILLFFLLSLFLELAIFVLLLGCVVVGSTGKLLDEFFLLIYPLLLLVFHLLFLLFFLFLGLLLLFCFIFLQVYANLHFSQLFLLHLFAHFLLLLQLFFIFTLLFLYVAADAFLFFEKLVHLTLALRHFLLRLFKKRLLSSFLLISFTSLLELTQS